MLLTVSSIQSVLDFVPASGFDDAAGPERFLHWSIKGAGYSILYRPTLRISRKSWSVLFLFMLFFVVPSTVARDSANCSTTIPSISNVLGFTVQINAQWIRLYCWTQLLAYFLQRISLLTPIPSKGNIWTLEPVNGYKWGGIANLKEQALYLYSISNNLCKIS